MYRVASLALIAALTVLASPLIGGPAQAFQEPAKKPVEMGDAVGKEFRRAGTVRIDDRLTGQVTFTEHQKAYRVDVSIPCALTDTQLKGERFTAWLLTADGKALPLLERPGKGALLMSSTGRSATAHAIFVMGHSVKVEALRGIVVCVDDAVTAFAIPKP